MAEALHLAPSIDAFLEKNSAPGDGTAFIGKLAIVRILSERENKSALNTPFERIDWKSLSNTWLGTMWPLLNVGGVAKMVEDFLPNSSFITFNYDRCIEQFISLAVAKSFKISYDEAREYTKAVQVEHVYGSLGDFFSSTSPDAFGSCRHESFSVQLVDKIKTFSEQVESQARDRMAALMNEASRIFFLGFSFAGINRQFLEEITPPISVLKEKEVFGTVYQMPNPNIGLAQRWANGLFTKGTNGTYFQDVPADKFFENNSLLFS